MRTFPGTAPSLTLSLVRILGAAAAAAALCAPAHASLTLPTAALAANSVQKFTADDLAAFDLVGLTVEARGNTYVAQAGVPGETNGTVTPVAFGFPITQVVVGSGLKIASGSATGSALLFKRTDVETGKTTSLSLANFSIDYGKKQVLADATPAGGRTTTQMPLYDFQVGSPLALKYKFPLSIALHEQLSPLKLTAQAKALLTSALELPEFATFALDFDYGSLTQDIGVKLRSKPVSSRPYSAR